MRRILIFSTTYYPRFVGGAEVAIKEITDRLDQADFEFDMVTVRFDRDLPKVEKIGNINIYRLGWTGKRNVSSTALPFYLSLNKYAFVALGLFKALRLNKTRNYYATWSIMASYNSFAAVLFKLIKPKIPFILTLQEGDPIKFIERRALPLWPLFKLIFRKADYIQTISTFLADWAEKMGAKCPVQVVPNGVDYDLFAKPISSDSRKHLRNALGFDDNDIVLVTTSRLVKKNAVNDIIDSLQYLDPKFKLLIIGNGPNEANIKSQISNLKVDHRVVLKGFIPNQSLPSYLQSSDIFVRPSLSEGLGISFLEAMAAGIPVITTAVGGITDFIRDGETGLVCEVNNPKSIAQKVDKLNKDREAREYIVQNSCTLVKSKYEWGIIVKQINEIMLTF